MNPIINKYGEKPLSENLPLRLSVREIAELWQPEDETSGLWEALGEAVRRGSLPAEVTIRAATIRAFDINLPAVWGVKEGTIKLNPLYSQGKAAGVRHDPDYENAMVHRDDFRTWLKKEGEWPLNPEIPLARWFTNEEQIPKRKTNTKSTNNTILWLEADKVKSKMLHDESDLTLTKIAESDEMNVFLLKRYKELYGHEKKDGYSIEYIMKKLGGTKRGRRKNRKN